jgi:hypothetical protein
METTAFFERKIGITPKDLNSLSKQTIDDILTGKLRELLEKKCSEHGFVLPGSIKLLSRSMGYYEHARFTGDAVYYVKAEGKVIYPADGISVIGKVIRKNKAGIYVDYKKALNIQVPRDLHLHNEDFDSLQIGDSVQVELKKSHFQINDPFILTNGLYIRTVKDGEDVAPAPIVTTQTLAEEEGAELEEEAEEEGEEEEEEAEEEEEEAEEGEEAEEDAEDEAEGEGEEEEEEAEEEEEEEK